MASPPPEPQNTSSTALVAALVAAGYSVVELDTAAKIAAAARGTAPYDTDANDVVYLIKNGTYTYGTSYMLQVDKGGLSAARKRYFIGETRHGVVIGSKAVIESDYIVVQNMKWDMSSYDQGGTYSTITTTAAEIEIRDVTMVSTYPNGCKQGGGIEVQAPTTNLVIDNCVIDGYGGAGTGNGSMDHGLYVGAVNGMTVTNTIIRNNASRGVQLYTSGGDYGVINNLTIRNCWIYGNGTHVTNPDYVYRDNILVSDQAATTSISNVLIEECFLWDGYYSGFRTAGASETNITVRYCTFHDNGLRVGVDGYDGNPSEINFDGTGCGNDTEITKCIFDVGVDLTNLPGDDPSARGFSIDDNVVNGSVPGTPNWVTNVVVEDPQFVNADGNNFHTQNPDVAAYGVYGS